MRRAALAMFLALCGLGLAPVAAADLQCNGISESAQTLRLARVLGIDKRISFVASAGDSEKTKSCPSANGVCRRNTFVVPEDVVLVETSVGGWSCATFVSPRGVATGGWLPTIMLDVAGAPIPPKLADFAGKWAQGKETTIRLTVKGQEIAVDGNASLGALDPDRVKRGVVRTGSITGQARPKGNMLAIGEKYDGVKAPSELSEAGECLGRLRLFGKYLVVEDSGNCGGMGVGFTGVYVRQVK